jgi:hypothetical protein
MNNGSPKSRRYQINGQQKGPTNLLRKPLTFLRAENGIRTHGPQLGKLMLYQLSYFRLFEDVKIATGGDSFSNFFIF